MPSRSASRIRRLIPHRRTLSGIDSRAQYDSDEGPEYEESDRRKDSWYIRRQQQPSKPARATSVQVAHNGFCPNITPRSSDSSLCSCGHNEDFASQPSTLRRPCLCILSSKNDRRSDESLQIPNTTYEDEDPSLERSSNSRHTDSPGLVRSSEESIASTSSSDSKETPPPRIKGIPRRSSETIYPQLPPEEFSDDIQKLIREADEAFKAVGSALDEVRLERYSSNEDTPPQATTLEEPPLMSGSVLDRPGPPTPDMSPILQQFPPRLTPHPQTRFNTSPALPPPTRNASVTKRKKSKKHPKSPKVKSPPKAVKARKPIPNRAAAAKHAPRWTLTENVTELFTGRLFNKVEVDEMLTEAQLEEYKRRRMSNLKTQQEQEASETLKPSAADATKSSSEAAPSSSEAKPSETKSPDTDSLDTPIEPFHLEDLPSRIGSAGVKLTAETPVEEKKEVVVGPTFFYDDDPETQDFSVDRDELFLGEPSSNSTSTSGGSVTTPAAAGGRGGAFSAPPPTKKSLKGLMAGRKQPPGLPSIPEANSAPRAPSVMDELFLDLQQKKQQLQLQDSVADSDYVYLRASPCTLTAPGFRHGPIRVAKADLVPEPTLGGGADDGLDWTAFQMAILGGAGDWNSESDDTLHRRTVEELDDLVDWWESWHFENNGSGLGSLVTSEEAERLLLQTPPSPASTISGGGEYGYSDLSAYYGDIKQDNPYSAHHRWQTLRRQAAVQGLGLPGPKTSSFDDPMSNNSNNNNGNGSFNRDYHGRHSSKIFVPTTAALNPTTTANATAIPTSTFSTGGGGGGGMKPKPRPLPLELAGKPVEGDKLPPRFAADRHSLASLPQSPMLDLRVISDPEGDDVDVEVVPMGYNLGHDLGDFLKWEAEHVYAYSDVMM